MTTPPPHLSPDQANMAAATSPRSTNVPASGWNSVALLALVATVLAFIPATRPEGATLAALLMIVSIAWRIKVRKQQDCSRTAATGTGVVCLIVWLVGATLSPQPTSTTKPAEPAPVEATAPAPAAPAPAPAAPPAAPP